MILKPRLFRRPNFSHPLARGLVGCWLMNKGGGNKVQDLSGNRNHGTLVGDTKWVPGPFGPCLSFDGAGDYVDLGAGILDSAMANAGTTGFTYSVRLNLNNYVLNSQVLEAGNTIIHIEMELGKWKSKFYNGSIWADVYSNDAVATNQFINLVIVYNTTNLLMYLDGILQSDTHAVTGNPTVIAGRSVVLGANYTKASGFFDGSIDNVMIFNRALSASEIAELYRNPFYMFERDEMVLWQSFDEEPSVYDSIFIGCNF